MPTSLRTEGMQRVYLAYKEDKPIQSVVVGSVSFFLVTIDVDTCFMIALGEYDMECEWWFVNNSFSTKISWLFLRTLGFFTSKLGVIWRRNAKPE